MITTVRSLGNRGGMITTEFLILAPVLILMLFVAFSINRYLEQRQLLTVASRNISLQVDPAGNFSDEEFRQARAELARASLATDFDQAHAAMRYDGESAKLLAGTDGYLVSIERAEEPYGKGVGKTDPDRHAAHPGTDGFTRDFLNPLGKVIAGVNRIIDTILGAGFSVGGDRFVLFFEDNPSAGRVMVSIPGDAGLFERGLARLVEASQGNISNDELRTSHYHASYQRVQAGFHPGSYAAQGLVGWLLGLSPPADADWANADEFSFAWYDYFISGIPNFFTTHCMNNYRGGNDCVTPSWFAMIMDAAAIVKAVVCAFADIFGGSCTSASTLSNTLSEIAADEAIDAVVEGMERELRKEGHKIVREQIDKKKEELRTRMEAEVKKLRDKAVKEFMENLPLE